MDTELNFSAVPVRVGKVFLVKAGATSVGADGAVASTSMATALEAADTREPSRCDAVAVKVWVASVRSDETL